MTPQDPIGAFEGILVVGLTEGASEGRSVVGDCEGKSVVGDCEGRDVDIVAGHTSQGGEEHSQGAGTETLHIPGTDCVQK